MNQSNWNQLLIYINLFKVDDIITRQQLINTPFMSHKIIGLGMFDGLSEDGLDIYRNYLDKAGYLKSIKRGIYKIIKLPDINLTITKCKIEAYGHA